MPRGVRLLAFGLVAAVGIVCVGGNYAGPGRLVGVAGIHITVALPRTGGLFPNGEVTYRGVPIGRVEGLALADTGVSARLWLDPSAPPVPADSRVLVGNRSAVGEQYLELQPATTEARSSSTVR